MLSLNFPRSITNLGLRLQGLAASAAMVVLACAAYRYSPFAYQRTQFGSLYGAGEFTFTGEEFLFSAAVLYIILLTGYFFCNTHMQPAKALRFFMVVAAFVRSPVGTVRNGLTSDDRVAVLATLLKAFYAPIMTMSLLVFCQGAMTNGALLFSDGSLNTELFAVLERHAFWFCMQIILFFDVAIFTFGYLIELPLLRNEIRSVDPSILGWAAALACYPPFNAVTGYILGSTVSDFPQFDSPTIHVALNTLLLVLMGTYTASSVALGWKASNLTHRGIVDRGPYAVIRHPAYVCKNMAWWIGSFPILWQAFDKSLSSGMAALASIVAWSVLYCLRAVTEEDHLRGVNSEYAEYASRVRYRFIPGIV